MLEVYGNIWDIRKQQYGALVITTNGFVKKNGEAVMGRGIALEAKERFPELPKRIGEWILEHGNVAGYFYVDPKLPYRYFNFNLYPIITLPVKPAYGLNGESGWRCKADLALIEQSTKDVVKIVDGFGFVTPEHRAKYKTIMPRPGCGNGGLKWEDVKPVIEPLLDDTFTVCTFRPDTGQIISDMWDDIANDINHPPL